MIRVLGALVVAFILTGCSVPNVQTTPRATMQVGDQTYRVELARTTEQQAHGLSGRQSMENDEGMLFPYSPKTQPSFWMKGMRFAIDIIWIADEAIVGIEPNVVADDGARLYPAPQPIDAVLELAAGVATRDGLTVGDTVTYPPDTWK